MSMMLKTAKHALASDLAARAAQAASLLASMANAKRLLILCTLVEGEHSVSDLVQVVGLSQSALSQHLGRLREKRLVKTRRQARTIYYRLASDQVGRILGVLYDIYCKPIPAGTAGNRRRHLSAPSK